jgi:hypothetical protein
VTRRRRPGAVVALIASSGVLLGWAALQARPVAGQALDPVVIVDPATTQLGATVLVALQGWPPGPVTVSLCGDNANRGSEDCDPIGAQTVPIDPLTRANVKLPITTPPVSCPCVVRANTTTSDVVREAPVVVVDLPTGPLLPAGPSDAPQLHVVARVTTRPSWVAPFAGPAPKALVLTLHNTTDQQLTGLRLNGEVGRRAGDNGQPISSRLPDLAPGATRQVSVPFALSAPSWGHYVVTGSIYGSAVPVTYQVKTATEPWALELALPLLLILIAEILRYRERKERKAEEAAAAAEAQAWAPYAYPPPYRESSPGVGYPVDGRSSAGLYHPGRTTSVGFGAHVN